jgi:fimbrial chaperone protein
MSPVRYRSALLLARNAVVLVAAGACGLGSALAGFGVSPIRIDLDRVARTSSITVSNDDPDNPMRAQADAVSWVQDEDGNDRFEPTNELTFLPRIMTIPPADRQLVRVGIRVPATAQEKAFRLFIEEIPEARKQDGTGARIAVRVRFGIPVFVKPLKEEVKGEIDRLDISKSVLTMRVRNQGNVHLAIKSVDVSSGDLFSRQISGWYLLAGAARTQSIEIPVETCRKLKVLDVTVRTDQSEYKRRLEVDPSACS